MMINKRLIKEMGETKQYIGMQVLLQWAALLCNICLIFYISNVLWQVVKGNAGNISLILSIGVFAGVIAARRLFLRLEAAYSHRSSEYVKKKLRHRIYEHLLKVGEKYEKTFSTSEILQVAAEGVEQLEIYFGKYLPQLFYSLLAPITLFILVSFMSVKVALILFLCVPLIPASIIAIQKFAKKLLAKYWGSYVQLGDHFLDNIQGLTTLKVYQSDGYKSEEMNKDAEHFRKITMKVLTMQLNSVTLMDLIAYGGSALGVIFSCMELRAGNLNMKQALAIILLAAEFFIPLRLLGSFFHIAMNGMAASDKMFRLLDMEAEEVDMDDKQEREKAGEKNDRVPYAVSARQVTFAYEEEQPILKEVTVDIPSRSLVSVVGASGCGKSTLLRLIAGLEDCTTGEILVDGEKIHGASLNRGVVFQDYGLFPWKTAGANITLALKKKFPDWDKNHLKERTIELLKAVGLDESVYRKYPKELSGGMKQRCAIASAFGIDPPILLMDEPFGALDAVTRSMLQDMVLKLWEKQEDKKTVFFVTHDVDEAMILANRIIVLGQSPSNIIFDVKIPDEKRTTRDSRFEDPESIKLRNELLRQINQDVEAHVQTVQ